MSERILVIKLGALGDFIQALGPMAAVRRHHQDAAITLLTTAPYAAFAEASGYADTVWIDDRPGALALGGWLTLRRRLRSGSFRRVYDLQTSDRSCRYFRLFWPGPAPEWSGIAKGCSHPHDNPDRDRMHTVERQSEQLRMAGVEGVPPPDVGWARSDIERFGLDRPFALLVPGGARHRSDKRWPARRFAELAERLSECVIQPVLIGEAADRDAIASIAETVGDAVDLSGQTDLFDLAELGRRAALAVGNDTGPMHLIAAAGCPSVVLFSNASDPSLCGQRGPVVGVLRRPRLDDLDIDEVIAETERLGRP